MVLPSWIVDSITAGQLLPVRSQDAPLPGGCPWPWRGQGVLRCARRSAAAWRALPCRRNSDLGGCLDRVCFPPCRSRATCCGSCGMRPGSAPSWLSSSPARRGCRLRPSSGSRPARWGWRQGQRACLPPAAAAGPALTASRLLPSWWPGRGLVQLRAAAHLRAVPALVTGLPGSRRSSNGSSSSHLHISRCSPKPLVVWRRRSASRRACAQSATCCAARRAPLVTSRPSSLSTPSSRPRDCTS